MYSINNIRISEQAYKVAKERAEEARMYICEWISKAILESALLEDLTEDNDQ
ncbi:hypothetical protein [Sporanaerobium hydrogeniformans]|uniref:hypothetical protein n=1 Tax=Sporanaerobium hydrogeniformans TaxID=3072179 RepID=UPI0015D4CDF2|nr:hypothetical protein [Sporanaerobium hydrogeniformans]